MRRWVYAISSTRVISPSSSHPAASTAAEAASTSSTRKPNTTPPSLKPYSAEAAWGVFSSSIVPLGMTNRTMPSASISGAKPNVSVISALVAANGSGSRTMACQVMPSTFTVFSSRSSRLMWCHKGSVENCEDRHIPQKDDLLRLPVGASDCSKGYGQAYSPKCVELVFSEVRVYGVLRRLMCNELDQQIRQVAQRSAEGVVDPLAAGVRGDLGRQTSQQPAEGLRTVVLQREEILELADHPLDDLALARRPPAIRLRPRPAGVVVRCGRNQRPVALHPAPLPLYPREAFV